MGLKACRPSVYAVLWVMFYGSDKIIYMLVDRVRMQQAGGRSCLWLSDLKMKI